MTVTLPFPPAVLSPNTRSHWAQKYRAFKVYKTECVAMMLNLRGALKGQRKFTVTFHPPTARRMDLDNAISRFKAGQDALAVISGVDDSEFEMTYRFGEPVRGGAVIVGLA